MTIVYTVKTEERAIEIIREQLESDGLSFEDGTIQDTTVECECGETSAVMWTDMYGNCDKLLVVGICDCCGDDDAFSSDVLEII